MRKQGPGLSALEPLLLTANVPTWDAPQPARELWARSCALAAVSAAIAAFAECACAPAVAFAADASAPPVAWPLRPRCASRAADVPYLAVAAVFAVPDSAACSVFPAAVDTSCPAWRDLLRCKRRCEDRRAQFPLECLADFNWYVCGSKKSIQSLCHDFFRGTFAPFLRASESPMAMACFLLFTLPPLPPLPERSFPWFARRTARSTLLPAALPYFAIEFLLVRLVPY